VGPSLRKRTAEAMELTRNLVLLALLTGLAFLLFCSVIDSFFMGETLDYLGVINKRVLFHNLWGDTSWMSAHFARSAVRTMWGIEQYLFGRNPVGYHVVNILFHIANSLLAFLLLKRLLGSDRSVLVASAFASLTFLGHHGPAENVRWITERWDLSMCLFYVLALLFFMQYKRRKGKPYLLALSVASFAMSLCSKEMAFSFPLTILVYDFYYLSGLKKVWPLTWRRVLVHLPFWVTALLYFAYRFARYANVVDYKTAVKGTHSLLHSVTTYFAWFAYPFGAWGAIAVFVLAFMFGGRRMRFLALFVLITLLPSTRIPNIWRGYLPMFGFSMLLGAVLSRNWVSWFSRRNEVGELKPVNEKPVLLLRIAQVALFIVIFSANAFETFRDNVAWDRNATKAGALAKRLKADYPKLPPGTQVYIINMENAQDAMLHPMFLSPPLVFMYDEMQIEAFPFQQFYFNRARCEMPSPDRLYVYAYRNGFLGEDTYLKRALIEMETSRPAKAPFVFLNCEKALRTSDNSRDAPHDCLVFPTTELAEKRINTLLVQMQASAETDVTELTGELSWQSVGGISQQRSTAEIEFEIIPDGTMRTYRLAIGTRASWVFAEEIHSLKLRVTSGSAEAKIISVVGTQERFEQTDEKRPDWGGFDVPLHTFAMPRRIRMPKEKLDYFLYTDEK